MGFFEKYSEAVKKLNPIKATGEIKEVKGMLVESFGPQAVVGELCQILIPKIGLSGSTHQVAWAEVVGLRDRIVQLMPYDETEGIEVGCPVIATGEFLSIPVSEKLLGRVLDAMGKPIDGRGDIGSAEWYSIFNKPPDVLKRQRISKKIATGIRAVDGLITVGKGQRMGIFSGSGIGKSTLLGMIARNTAADVNVIALIGERGREVREFIEQDLGEEGLKRSVLVVASSNKPPLTRIRGAYVATTIAEYFRDQGLDVTLMFDSVTRFARAQREIGLSIGEPPATRGFTPSVFSLLPKLLERSGTSDKGTITGFYTVLVEGDDLDEPVSDAVRGILDGHIVLSRVLSERYHYPAIDILQSLSRLAVQVTGPHVQEAAGVIRRLQAVYKEAEDLINVGAYAKGSNPDIDEAIERIEEINQFLRQEITEKTTFTETYNKMSKVSGVNIPEGELADEAISVQAKETA